MSIIKNSWLKTGVRIIIGIIFIISAWFKLIGIDSFEIYIYSFGFLKLTTSFLLARFIISFELLLGVLLVLGVFSRQAIYTSLIMLISFSVFLILLLFKGETEHCHCFGDILEMSHTLSIIKNLTLVFFLILIYNKLQKRIKFDKYILLGLSIISISIPLVISPPDSFNYEEYASKANYSEKSLNEYLADNEDIKGRKILCFYGVSCRFCKLSAKKIAVISDKVGISDLIIYVFWGEQNKIDTFFSETNTPIFPYTSIEVGQFLRITEGKMPLILLMEGDSVIHKFGYRDIDEQKIIDFLLTE